LIRSGSMKCYCLCLFISNTLGRWPKIDLNSLNRCLQANILAAPPLEKWLLL
jgi:hypothetical protein